MNEFEQVAQVEQEVINLPPLPPYQPLNPRPFKAMERNRHVFKNDDPSRALWLEDEFFQVKGNLDPIYLSAGKDKVDLITLVHRLKPTAAPYEDREWQKYINAGGRCHSEDTAYLIHPLTAFFFARWMKADSFLSHANLYEVFTPHAKKLVEMALEQFKEAEPISYDYEMAGLSVCADAFNLIIDNQGKTHKFKVKCNHQGSLSPEDAASFLKSTFTTCDSALPIVFQPKKHPPFYKSGFKLPLWQQIYAAFGLRTTAILLQERNLWRGCMGCPDKLVNACSFVFARAGL